MVDSAADLMIEFTAAESMYALREPLMERYRDAYADKIDHPFFTEERYWERLEAYATRDTFTLALGYLDDVLVGYALGYTVPKDSRWPTGLLTEVDPDLVVEDGHRTFALNYIMVGRAWRRRHIAKALHDALMSRRTEQRALLLVLPDNVAASLAYRAWGWYKIGDLKPFEDAPIYDAMMLDLNPATSRQSSSPRP